MALLFFSLFQIITGDPHYIFAYRAMFKQFGLVLLLTLPALQGVGAGYLDENPDEVFAEVYQRLGTVLPVRIARDPYVWLRLDELKREPCDQVSINDLALMLDNQHPPRQT